MRANTKETLRRLISPHIVFAGCSRSANGVYYMHRIPVYLDRQVARYLRCRRPGLSRMGEKTSHHGKGIKLVHIPNNQRLMRAGAVAVALEIHDGCRKDEA